MKISDYTTRTEFHNNELLMKCTFSEEMFNLISPEEAEKIECLMQSRFDEIIRFALISNKYLSYEQKKDIKKDLDSKPKPEYPDKVLVEFLREIRDKILLYFKYKNIATDEEVNSIFDSFKFYFNLQKIR